MLLGLGMVTYALLWFKKFPGGEDLKVRSPPLPPLPPTARRGVLSPRTLAVPCPLRVERGSGAGLTPPPIPKFFSPDRGYVVRRAAWRMHAHRETLASHPHDLC